MPVYIHNFPSVLSTIVDISDGMLSERMSSAPLSVMCGFGVAGGHVAILAGGGGP